MIAAILAPALALGTPLGDPEPIVIGENYTVEAVEAERAVNVILPRDYATREDERFPVVFVLDGGRGQDLMLHVGIERWNRLWSRSREAIVVGIETKDRQRELLPPTATPAERERFPTAGEAAAFRDWLVDTIRPAIAARYRTDGTAILVGESAAGHFVSETWAMQPDAFDGYAAISPSLQWNGMALANAFPSGGEGAPPLYLSLADEGGDTEAGTARVLAKLSDAQPLCFSDRRDDLVHANTLHGLLPEALQYLLPTQADWLDEFGLTLRCDPRDSLAD